MISKLFFTIVFLLASVFLFAQEVEEHPNEKHENLHEHEHLHEFGVSVSPVYFVKEKDLSAAVHLHYTYNIPETKFGLGFAYEHIFDEHSHNFLGMEATFRPVHPLSLSVTPGLTYERKDFSQKEFAVHFETAYEFEISSFHLGPALEFAYHSEDIHLSLGLHLGFGF